MDSYAPHPAQLMGQQPFFYYNPDENRQQSQFMQLPHGMPNFQPQPTHNGPLCPPQMTYSRPSSSDSHASYHHQQAYGPSRMMTPAASPQPMVQKPTILIQQGSPYLYPLETDSYTPATPPLSATGSAVSSPPSTCDILPTPVTSAFFGNESIEGVKKGCEGQAFAEILAGDEWVRAASPPMTPGQCRIIFFCVEFP